MNYIYYPKNILRTPLKPLKTSFSEEELIQLFNKKEVQEALFLSSPNLLNEFIKWQNREITNKKEEEKLFYSLLKYALRMHSRCTPYGLFAACGVVDNDKIICIDSQKLKRSTRLDMNFTCALAQELAKKSFIQPYIKFYSNTSIYNLYDKTRYVEYFYENKKRIHQISSVDNSEYLQEVIKTAKQGATIQELAILLTSQSITYQEAEAFIKEIINSQILVSELEPSVTGDELLSQILSVLTNLDPNPKLVEIISLLGDIQKEIHEIDLKIGNKIFVYEKVIKKLNQLNIPIELNKLFQTDLFSYQTNSNNEKFNTETVTVTQGMLIKALKILNKLSFYEEHPNLKSFKEKFHQRYENQEVSLMEVLDNEAGIGYGLNNNQRGDYNPLIENIILPNNSSDRNEIIYYKQQSFLFKKLIKSHQNKEGIIFIKEEDVKDYNENWNDLPNSISVMYSSLGIQNNKEKLCIDYIGGSSAINLLGRFASGNQEIEKIIKEIAQHEQSLTQKGIVASILHLPESRSGNILLRPVFREYEIPYLSKSSLPQNKQIPLNDLFISIKNNQIILRSKELNKLVIPRLDNAHNFSYNSLPVYHFLCDLQTQSLRENLFFDWGVLKNEFSFLPRVEIEGVVVSMATWQLKKTQYQSLLKKNIDIKKEAIIWQKKWLLPHLIFLVEGDNKLLINLKDELSLKMFVSEIQKQDSILLKEFLFNEKSSVVRDENENVYTNEMISIFLKHPTQTSILPQELNNEFVSNNKNISRDFSLGSEWLYYKIYCGVKTADKILTEVIKPLIEKLDDRQLIDSWFFIRYADPDIHLRVRFHVLDTSKIGDVITLFYKVFNDYQTSNLVWKIQTDIYQREIERYGANTMVLSEQLFYYDSMSIVGFLDQVKSNLEELRWLFGIKSIDELLNNFKLNTKEKLIIMEGLKIGFAEEFNMNKNLKLQLDKRYRDKRIDIETFLWNKKEVERQYQPIIMILNIKREQMSPVIQEILEIHRNQQLELPLNDLLASHIHMLLNRLFKSKQRLHEMIIYDFLWRSYRSKLAKEKQLSNSQL